MTHGVDRAAEDMIQQALLGEAIDAAAEVGAFVLDEHGRYVAVNSVLCDLAGHSREELIGREIGAFNAHLVDEYAAVRAGRTSGGRTWIDRNDGTRIEVEYRASRTQVARMPFLLVVCWPVAS